MAIKSLKILLRMDFPAGTLRLWMGSGPYMDSDGAIWTGAGDIGDGALDQIEMAMNGEAYTLSLALSGVPTEIADAVYQENQENDVVGSIVQILLQECDEYDQPIASDPVVQFTGTIDNIIFDDAVVRENHLSQVTVEVSNRFDLRRLTSGSVYSDVDQRARSAVINPGADPDQFCERVPLLFDKTVKFPDF
jgi:hypothetical protein